MSTLDPIPDAQQPTRVQRRRFASLRTISALILREMATTYGRTPGGYIWAVLEPVAGIAILSAMFSILFASPTLGISFPLFYATGLMPFTAFMAIQNTVSRSLLFSLQLLSYPSVTFIDAILARFILNALTQMLVMYIVFTGILLLTATRTILHLETVAIGLGLMMLLGLGWGTFNCFMVMRFDVYARLWSILMRPMFIMSGILFLPEAAPDPYGSWLKLNPITQTIALIRKGFYITYSPDYGSAIYVLLWSLIPMAIGMALLHRYYLNLITR